MHELTEKAAGHGFCRQFFCVLCLTSDVKCFTAFWVCDGGWTLRIRTCTCGSLRVFHTSVCIPSPAASFDGRETRHPPSRLTSPRHGTQLPSPGSAPRSRPPRIQPAPQVPRIPGPLHKPAQGSRSAEREMDPRSVQPARMCLPSTDGNFVSTAQNGGVPLLMAAYPV